MSMTQYVVVVLIIPFGYAYVASICEARRKTYFRRYEEAAELMPRTRSSPALATRNQVSRSLELSE
jgi:hypothetical protein